MREKLLTVVGVVVLMPLALLGAMTSVTVLNEVYGPGLIVPAKYQPTFGNVHRWLFEDEERPDEEDEERLVETAPPVTEPLSEESMRQLVVREIVGVRDEVEATGFGATLNAIRELLNRAADADTAAEGARMIRTELPALEEDLRSRYPSARQTITRSTPTTETARAMKTMLRATIDEQFQLFTTLAADVERSGNTWRALQRWGERNNELVEETRERVERILRSAPADERDALLDAIEGSG